ncbi:hypothetical protein D8K06_25225, partial [Vibrio parahaemolyticus]|nr:hypothetical protein [Vibrio parahaemolyticus]
KTIELVKKLIKRLIKRLRLDRTNVYLNLIEKKEIESELSKDEKYKIQNELTRFEPNVILFFWGTTLRKELAHINTLNLCSKKILLVNTYPIRTRFESWSDNPFLVQDKDYFSSFDKIIFPSEYLYNVFYDSGFLNGMSFINPDFILSDHVCKFREEKENIENESANKKIIFLGNTNFSERSIDDVSEIIIELASKGVNVFVQKSDYTNEKLSAIDNIFTFPPFSFEEILSGKLLDYINDFDGVLFSYNDVCSIRYNGSITTRLLLAEGAQVPVYIFGDEPKYISEMRINGDFKVVKDSNSLIHCLNNHEYDNKGELYVERANKFLKILKDK